ncbi:ribonuclease E/G [Acidocella sp. MX-AZ02]|uniref:Rne/Rng family ribonuclease n=1 Tax=Acidocella sp. MX-AZ02 TaxID=1214225 RepID=UPI00034C1C53|nr:ribonuclease E/G [Acidocella sp. MX-AZ02]
MSKKMLIDASHAEETRVVVLDGNRLDDFDVETVSRKQIKGNIYLAKVIRVEPSLQAAFVEYGGNRHGFLAFGEIHPDYYQIPVADRQKLLDLQAEAAAEDEDEPEDEAAADAKALEIKPIEIHAAPPPEEGSALPHDALSGADEAEIAPDPEAPADASAEEAMPAEISAEAGESDSVEQIEPEGPAPEQIGGDGDDAAEARERRLRQRFLRNYKIQDVIHRRQIMLVQVVKEERGNKGAALTTYLSLAGRFSVLMPNSPTGGGVSRKITSQTDRRRLKETMAELDIPPGMGMIVRTAGANRPKPEIKRDCEYLLRLWDDIRDKTLESSAPALIYEEASLIKRAIRDVYTKDVEDILVDGVDGFKAARDFMRMLMPANARKVQLWQEGQPLFAKHQVEAQLDAMLNPVVQLRSGGYIVINQTEALVAIDVNSGRSTRERSIEDTALRTNMEAAEEVAKQLRMRDLAGLIVIDFIDMESRRNNAAVERKLKDALKHDRARIQVGSISHFGLMEMSRQRLRPSLTEASLITCPHCAGMGHVRSPESAALHILRAIEDEGAKFKSAEICVYLPPEIAFYLFNHKRERLSAIEERYSMRVIFEADARLTGTNFRLERTRAHTAPPPAPAPMKIERVLEAAAAEADEADAELEEAETTEAAEAASAERGERKRRRRRRGRRRGENGQGNGTDAAAESEGDAETGDESAEDAPPTELDLALEAAFRDAEAMGPAEAELAETAIEAAPEAAVILAAEAAPDAAPAKPKRAPRKRKPAAKDGAKAEPEAAPAEAIEATPVEVAAVAELEAAPAKPKRAPRKRKPAAKDGAKDAAPAEIAVPVEAIEAAPVEVTAVPEATEIAAEPVVKPILVGATEAPAAKKTGWWRR